MKAVRIHEDGPSSVLLYEDVPAPGADAGQVLVQLAAASLNHIDVWVRRGLPSVPKPRILGADGAGTVVAVGSGVDGDLLDQRVVVLPGVRHGHTVEVLGEHTDGTYCELIALPATQVRVLDEHVSFPVAAAFPLTYMTAFRMLFGKADAKEGEWVLIWGIGGGVAAAAFEICRARGLRTIATSGNVEKLEAARSWGADMVLNHFEDDVVAEVRAATAGGADIIIESVGEATWRRSLDAARPGARIVVCGATTGSNPPAALHRFWWKDLSVFGSSLGDRHDFEQVYELIRSGRSRVQIDSTFPLKDAAAAHDRLEAGKQLGKIVLEIT